MDEYYSPFAVIAMSRKALILNSIWVTIRYGVVSISGLIISLGFAHFSSKETLGQYQFVLSLLALFSVFSLPGLNMAALQAIAKNKLVAVLDAVWWSFKTSLLALPFLLGYGWYLLAHDQTMLGVTIMAASLIFPFFYGPNTWYVFYEGRSIFWPVALRTIIASGAVMITIVLATYWQFNIFWLVVIYLTVSAGFTSYFFWEVRKKILSMPSSERSGALNRKYGLHVSAQKFVYTLSESLPPLAVSFMLGHVAVANFQVANLFLGAMTGFIGALAAISLPRLFSEIDSFHKNVFLQNIVIGALAAVGYYLIVRIGFLLLYGHDYQESYLLALTLFPLPFFISLRTFLINYFTAQQRNGLIVVIYVIANSLALVGFYWAAHAISFVKAAALYLYLLNLLLLLPLLIAYMIKAFYKTYPIKNVDH